jgi:hypothetical protein
VKIERPRAVSIKVETSFPEMSVRPKKRQVYICVETLPRIQLACSPSAWKAYTDQVRRARLDLDALARGRFRQLFGLALRQRLDLAMQTGREPVPQPNTSPNVEHFDLGFGDYDESTDFHDFIQ